MRSRNKFKWLSFLFVCSRWKTSTFFVDHTKSFLDIFFFIGLASTVLNSSRIFFQRKEKRNYNCAELVVRIIWILLTWFHWWFVVEPLIRWFRVTMVGYVIKNHFSKQIKYSRIHPRDKLLLFSSQNGQCLVQIIPKLCKIKLLNKYDFISHFGHFFAEENGNYLGKFMFLRTFVSFWGNQLFFSPLTNLNGYSLRRKELKSTDKCNYNEQNRFQMSNINSTHFSADSIRFLSFHLIFSQNKRFLCTWRGDYNVFFCKNHIKFMKILHENLNIGSIKHQDSMRTFSFDIKWSRQRIELWMLTFDWHKMF